MSFGAAPPILFVIGPTGTGKSALALQVARELDAEIVNCDSRQVYADFPCITAQPSAEEKARCAHHLYGFLPSTKSMDAGKFVRMAQDVLADLQSRGKLPVLVGGTGLYMRSLVYGLAPIPDIPQDIHERILTLCQEQGPGKLHHRLQDEDPDTASRLHPHDWQRITRALEVYAATGRPLSWWIRMHPCDQPRYAAKSIGLWSDLEVLTPFLQARIENMCAQGAVQEVEQAWRRCPDESVPGWSGIGCWELLQAFLGRWSLEEAKRAWLKNTRAYAKRQLTWFKKEPSIDWWSPGQDISIVQAVKDWLGHSGVGTK
ncbi:MAG: tRNA (adenosine(37)-N6)-dimethylallyltransferase MiaA [Thermodesulfobacteriota bacterium]